MALQHFNQLPYELQRGIIRQLPSPDLLNYRLVSSRSKHVVDTLPEYRTYKQWHAKVKDVFQQRNHPSIRDHEWTEGAAPRLLEIVRQGHTPSDHLLVKMLWPYTK